VSEEENEVHLEEVAWKLMQEQSGSGSLNLGCERDHVARGAPGRCWEAPPVDGPWEALAVGHVKHRRTIAETRLKSICCLESLPADRFQARPSEHLNHDKSPPSLSLSIPIFRVTGTVQPFFTVVFNT
jgi:hypothetical protein